MAITIGDAILYLRANPDALDRDLLAAERKTQSWAGKVGGFLHGALQATVGGVIQTGLAKVGEIVGQITSAMIDGNAEMEQYATSFEVMLGSADKAGGFLADLKREAASTPFEFPDLAKNSQTLLAFGVNAKEIIPTLRMLGDVSSGDANKLNSLSLVFGQVASAGKLTGGDLLQLVNVGFNPLQIISQKTGKSMAELRADMENGLITYDMVKDAFKSATGEGGQFNGMMEKQSQTAKGLQSTLNDMLGEVGRDIGKPFFDMYKEGLGKALEMLSSPAIKNSLKDFTDWIAKKMFPAVKQFSALVMAQLVPGLKQLWTWLTQLAEASMPAIQRATKFVMDNWKLFAVIAGVVSVALLSLIAPITSIIAALVLLATAWANNWGGIKTKTEQVINFIKPFITNAMDFIAKFINDTLNKIEKWWDENGVAVMRTITELWTKAKAAFDGALTFINNLIQRVLGYIQDWWEKHGDNVIRIVTIWLDGVRRSFDTTLATLSALVSVALAAIKKFWEDHGATIVTVVTAMWNIITAVFEGAARVIGGIVDAFAAALQGDWDGLRVALLDIWDALWDTVVIVLQNAAGAIIAAALDLVNTIIDQFDNVDWAALPQQIIDAIVYVFDNAAGIIYEVAGHVVAWFQDAFNSVDWAALPQTIIDAIVSVFGLESAYQSMRAAAGAMVDAIQAAFNTDWGALIADLFNGLIDALTDTGSALFQGLIDAASDVGSAIYQAIWDAIMDTLGLSGAGRVNTSAGRGGGFSSGSTAGALRSVSNASALGGGSSVINNYYLNANYAYQSASSLADTVRGLQMLGAAT